MFGSFARSQANSSSDLDIMIEVDESSTFSYFDLADIKYLGEKSDQYRLNHLMEAILALEEFVQDVTKEEFLNDKRIQSAVLYQFIIIGETVSSLSMAISENSDYPWHKPRAFRNFIANEYFGIKMWMVWNAIVVELPELKRAVSGLIK